MPQAILAVRVPSHIWLGDLTREYPEATFRILAALPDAESGIAMAEITADDVDAVLADMEAYDEVTHLEVIGRPDSTALVQFETSQPLLLMPLRESGALLDLPFEICDGRANWTVSATHERLSSLGEELRALNINFEVESINQQKETAQLLTKRQENLLETAVEEGYYDTPRGCTLTELAEAVGIAKSTASETLHRAESQIVKDFVEDVDIVG